MSKNSYNFSIHISIGEASFKKEGRIVGGTSAMISQMVTTIMTCSTNVEKYFQNGYI